MNNEVKTSFITDEIPIDIFQPYHEALTRWFSINKERLESSGHTKQNIQDALSLYKELGKATTSAYISERKWLLKPEGLGVKGSEPEEFKKTIETLQKNILTSGTISALPKIFWMSREESIAQCARADVAFTERPDLQKLLADANYSFFTDNTMNNGGERYVKARTSKGMTNLDIGNSMIGLVLEHHLEMKLADGVRKFEIHDLGSGSGATLNKICDVLIRELRKSEIDATQLSVDVHAYDCCNTYLEKLRNEIVPAIKERAYGNGININLHVHDIDLSVYEDGFGTPDSAYKLFTSNFVFHRLTDQRKDELVKIISESANYVAFLFADMYRNTSGMPNRGYFNFGLNGPLNPGNDEYFMIKAMAKHGFRPHCFSDGKFPMPNELEAQTITNAENMKQLEQGFVVAGYKGHTS
jgi:hypothetical protein